MGNDIYYFAGTGNSPAIARRLAAKTEARLLSISKTDTSKPVAGSVIGVVFPT